MHGTRWSKLWLKRSHPNYYVIYLFTLVHFFWNALNGLIGGEEFSIPVLDHVNAVASPQVWGVSYLVVTVLLLVGLFRANFKVAKLGLAIGLLMQLSRFLLVLSVSLAEAVAVANTLPNLLVVVGVLISQSLEPPVNPATGR